MTTERWIGVNPDCLFSSQIDSHHSVTDFAAPPLACLLRRLCLPPDIGASVPRLCLIPPWRFISFCLRLKKVCLTARSRGGRPFEMSDDFKWRQWIGREEEEESWEEAENESQTVWSQIKGKDVGKLFFFFFWRRQDFWEKTSFWCVRMSRSWSMWENREESFGDTC